MLKREAPRIRTDYVYRRALDARELLPALGVGVGVMAGLSAAKLKALRVTKYVARKEIRVFTGVWMGRL